MGSFSGGSTGVTINSTEPVSPNAGEIWVDNANEILYQRNASNDGWITLIREPLSDNLISNNSESISDYTIPSSVSTGASASSTATMHQWDSADAYINGTAYNADSAEANDSNTSNYDNAEVGGNSTKVIYQWEQNATIQSATNITIKLAYVNYYNSGSAWAEISTDGTNWTNIGSFAISSSWPNWNNRTLNVNPNSDVKYVRIKSTCPNNQKNEFRIYYCQITGGIPEDVNNVKDDDTGTKWSSGTSLASAYLKIDMGSSSRTGQIALYPHADTTETEFLIQSSSDDVTYSTIRTINVGDLVIGQWNYIRFNPTTDRYFKLISNTGTNLAMAFNQVKIRSGITDTDMSNSHSHASISTTSTNIGLSG